MTADERDQLLIRLDERTAKLGKVIEGNGQPGLVQRTSGLESAMDGLRSNFRLAAWIVGIVVAAGGVLLAIGK